MKHSQRVRRSLLVRCLPLAALTAAGLALLPATVAAQAVADAQSRIGPIPKPGPALPDLVQGDAAVARLGSRVDDIAAQLQQTKEELLRMLREDPTLWVNDDDRLLFLDAPPAKDFQFHEPPRPAMTIPLEDAFLLHTNPGANNVIHLDFDGHHSKSNGWGHNIQFPAFNIEGSASSFTDNELRSIIAHWEYMAEDFAPFGVDLTTEEPPEDYLRKNLLGDMKFGVRCVFTQPTNGFGNGIGGVAFVGSFTDFNDTPVFVFNKGDNNGSMSGSHEVGHALGLFHDGLFGQAYHPGTGSGATSWGPIMGAPFGRTVVHWNEGDYSGATTGQKDLAIISSFGNGFGYLSDDYLGGLPNATPLPLDCADLSTLRLAARIHRNTDVDAFLFETSGGTVTIDATTHSPGPNLDILLELYDASENFIESDNPNNDTDASITRNLAAGTYKLLVEGVGKPGTYSDNGSMGQYELTVSAPPLATGLVDLGSALAGTGGTPSLAGDGFACDGDTVTVTLSNALPNAPAFLAFGVGQINAPFKGGTMVPNITVGAFIPLTVSGAGTIVLPLLWPAGVVAGIPFDFQYWIVDGGGPFGWSASNALEMLSL